MDGLIENARRETEALLWREEWGFYRPDHSRGLNTVMPTIFELLGAPVPGFDTMTGLLPQGTPRNPKRVLLLCVDALGYKEFFAGGRFPALYRDFGTWVTSVFPTITSCALTSLAQGLSPARHGITGHEIWKDSPGAVVDMLRMCVVGAPASLADSGFDVNQWRREPGLTDTEIGRNLSGYHLLPYRFVNSGLSTFTYNNRQRIGYVDFPEGMAKAAAILSDMEHGWVSLYHGQVDALSHVLGGEHGAVRLAVRHIEEATTWLADTVPPRVAEETLLVVVADHGQNTTKHFLPLHGEPEKWLAANTRAVGFSGRVMHVYLGDHPAGPAREWLRNLVGEAGLVTDFEEAAELTGEVRDPDFVRQSLGDLVVLLREGWNWEKRPHDPAASPYESRLVSQHGCLGWEEMFIPLLAAPLSTLRTE